MAFGLKTLTTSSGTPFQVSYDGHIEWKAGSIKIDWSAVAAVSGSDLVLAGDQLTVPIGQKVLVAGQVMCEIASTGLYGPYDPAQTGGNGREVLNPGKCGILNSTIIQTGVLNITAGNTDDTNLIEGGRVWYARIRQSVAATHTLAAGPTLAELLAALPRLQLRY
jgi:hypothetical protein